ncbi:TraA family conjugative transfer protein [Pseudomonas aeruginosa]|uniref:TraA family conjugative transfer protein n=1 Tax=Pseudomonas aeruginosa TaxID=287 RepID=UPI000A6D9812|nr:TraA family conjugative transfer protein [Pseudomonas aeruginosa]
MKDQTLIAGDFQTLEEQNTRRRQTMQALMVVGLLFAAQVAIAGTGGDSFDSIWVTLTDWMQGTLGRVVAGAMVLVGIVGGIVRQSIMSFATGVGGGVGLYNTPTIIESIMTATLHVHS